jgi:hypothetical protein
MEIKKQISLSEFRDFMFAKTVPIRNLLDHKGEPLEKVLSFWRRNELLPFIEPGKWLEVSFAQLIWIRILDDLRRINFPVDKMKMLCDYFFKDAYFDDLPKKNLEYNKKEIQKRKKLNTQTEEDEQMLSHIENVMKYDKALTILKFDVNYLSDFIARSIADKEDGNIYIFFDGTVAEYIGQDYWGHKNIEADRQKPYICLTISHYLKEFIADKDIEALLMPQLLNDDETKVLREVRRKNIKEIRIYKNDNKKPMKIETTKIGVITNSEAKHIKEILGLKNYERIELKTMDEKSLSFKVTRKQI